MTADLVPDWLVNDLSLTNYPFSVDRNSEVEVGEPEMVVESVQSDLSDGELERVVRHGNRTYVIPIYIEGPSLAEVSAAEAELRTELTRPNSFLTHDPGDGFAPASLYEISTARLTPRRDDTHESHLMRAFTITLTCSPFALSSDEITVPAIAPPTTTSTISVDTCDSATGWTATVNGSAAAVSTTWEAGAVSVVELVDPAPQTLALTRSGAVDFSSTRYLVAEVGYNAGAPLVSIKASVGGRQVTQVSQTVIAPGWYRCVYDTGGVAATSLTFSAASTTDFADLKIRQVSRSSLPPGSSGRQTTRIVDVGGTERTPASLHAFTSTGYLGMTLTHTTPFDGSGYAPDMRRWRSSGNTTSTNAGARKITGTWEAMKPNPVISRTPAHSMPRGDYLLVAAIKSDTVTTNTPLPISWAVKSVISGQVLGSNEGIGYGWFPVAHALTIVPIAAFAAPVVRSGALDVEVHLLNPTSTAALDIEEWWMFKDDEDSGLSMVNTSEGALWLDSPDVSSGVPEIWVGPTKPLAYHPAGGLVGGGQHTFKPGQVLVTTISDTNDYLQVDLTYRERWHSNAAR